MKKILFFLIALGSFFHVAVCQKIFKERNLLTGIGKNELTELIPEFGDWRPYPLLNDRDAWQMVPSLLKDSIIKKAHTLIGTGYVSVPATAYLEYVRSGKRVGGGSNSEKLTYMMLAEIFENKGVFIDEIINGVWAICEASSWVGSAHLHMQKVGSGLPDVTDPVVDLGVGSTVNLLCFAEYYFGEKFDAVNPLIRKRLYSEVNERLLIPCLERNDFWWMGNGPYLINNWNPWICSNWLMAILIFEKDSARRIEAIWKTCQIVDKFINSYPDDGGCDEGPAYWFHAGGHLFDYLEILYTATNGKINKYSEPLIQEIARYLYRVHIADDYFVNFADAGSKSLMIHINQETVFRYGQRIGDSVLMAFAASFPPVPASEFLRYKFSAYRTFRYLFAYNEFTGFKGATPFPGSWFFPDRQVMISRDKAGSADGFFVAAKGGHNNESHNHNDVGNYIVYFDGKPVIIDAGVGEYNAKTFSDKRYEIWTMQSQYHNLPSVNGVMEEPGEIYAARNVVFKEEAGIVDFTLDIAGAYPSQAGVESWIRTIKHDKGNTITVTEKYKLSEIKDSTTLNMLLAVKPQLIPPNTIHLGIPENDSVYLEFKYDCKIWRPSVETIIIEDTQLEGAWGKQLYRLKLTGIKPAKTGKCSIVLVPIKKS